jgi:hypothetical protein
VIDFIVLRCGYYHSRENEREGFERLKENEK